MHVMCVSFSKRLGVSEYLCIRASGHFFVSLLRIVCMYALEYLLIHVLLLVQHTPLLLIFIVTH